MDQDEKELKRAKNAAYRFLAVRPRSRAEVERRLAGFLERKGFSSGTIREVLRSAKL